MAKSGEEAASKGDAFCGLAVRLDDDGDLRHWLSEFLRVLRYRKGVVHSTLEIVGVRGDAVWYRHRSAKDETALGERALLNGLRHHGLNLSARQRKGRSRGEGQR